MSLPKELDGKRLCWKCEGSVSIHVAQCPYCSAFLQDPPVTGSSFSSCHLSSDRSQEPSPEDSAGMFSVSSSDWDAVLATENHSRAESHSMPNDQEESLVDWKAFLPFVMTTGGLGLVMFALLLFLFAKDGVVTLSWNKNAMMYCFLVGAPVLYKGYRMLAQGKHPF